MKNYFEYLSNSVDKIFDSDMSARLENLLRQSGDRIKSRSDNILDRSAFSATLIYSSI